MQKDSEKNMSIKKLWKWKALCVLAHNANMYIFLFCLVYNCHSRVNGFSKWMAHGVLFLNSPSCQSKVGLQTYSSIRTIIWLVLQIKATQHVWNGDSMEVSSWPRTQAPTAAPSAPAPVPPAAQLRHWPGPPSSTHSPPRSCSTRRSAPPTVSFRADHPPGQLETSNSAMCQSLQQKRLRLEFNVTHRDNWAERGRGAKWFTLNVVDARSHKDHIRFEISRTESHHCLNVGVKKQSDNTAVGVKCYSWSNAEVQFTTCGMKSPALF